MKRIILILLSCIILVGGGLIGNHYLNREPVPLSYPSFLEKVAQQQVGEVILSEDSNTFEAILKGADVKICHSSSEDREFYGISSNE